MLDLTTERPLTLEAAARLFPAAPRGRRCHLSTVLRWILTGSRAPDGSRVKLEGARVGGRWFTTREAIKRFSVALTPQPADAPTTLPPRTVTQRRRAAERAGAELQK